MGTGRWGQGPLRWGRSIVNGDGAAVVVGRVVEGRRLDASKVHAPALEFKQNKGFFLLISVFLRRLKGINER